MSNLAEDFQVELERNVELLGLYRELPSGGFGANVIQDKITRANKAVSEGDTVSMLSIYQELCRSQ